MIKKRQCKVNNLYIPARMVKDKNNLLRKKKYIFKKDIQPTCFTRTTGLSRDETFCPRTNSHWWWILDLLKCVQVRGGTSSQNAVQHCGFASFNRKCPRNKTPNLTESVFYSLRLVTDVKNCTNTVFNRNSFKIFAQDKKILWGVKYCWMGSLCLRCISKVRLAASFVLYLAVVLSFCSFQTLRTEQRQSSP